MYAVVTDDYVYGACGDHLSVGIKEAANQQQPPSDRVTVFWRP